MNTVMKRVRETFTLSLGVLVLFGVLSFPAIGAEADDPESTVVVQVGRTAVVDTPGVERVALGTSGLVDVRAFPEIGQILLIGRSAGVSDLRVWQGDGSTKLYRLRVTGDGKAAVTTVDPDELAKLFSEVAGIRVVKVDDGRVVISGQAQRSIDYERAEAVAASFDGVVNQVTPPALEREATVLVEARILEVSRNEIDRFGINWDSAVSGPGFSWLYDWDTNDVFRPSLPDDLQLTGGGASGLSLDVGSQDFAGWAGSWNSTIDLLREDGVAKSLAEPRLTTISGQEASFLSGGEVPYSSVSSLGFPIITFKDYGISLDILPEADPNGLIRTEVSVEVSAIDEGVSVNGQPGLTTRTTDTVMNVDHGESMVISGLLNREESKTVDSVPGISRIPIIGELFKTRGFRDTRTEIVIIVTPYLVTPDSPRMKKMKQRGREMIREADADIEFSIYD